MSNPSLDNLNAEVRKRFWTKVRKRKCWLWIAGKFERGYGAFSVEGSTRRAHRISWMIARGGIPDGLYVLHKCDVTSCVRPSHLFLGTAADNKNDAVRKGRHAHGQSIGVAKLTPTKVRKIRRLLQRGRTQMAVARQFGVCKATVWYILHRHTWSHVR